MAGRKIEYSEEDVARVVEMLASRKSFRWVSHKLGMSLGMVQRIWRLHGGV